MKVEITQSFCVFVSTEGGGEKRVEFTKGMVVDEANMAAGQSAQDWIDKGLAKAVPTAPAGVEPAHEAGPAV